MTRTPIAHIQLPEDLHGELAKTLQNKPSTVKVAAAPFSAFASAWLEEAGPTSSECVSGNRVD